MLSGFINSSGKKQNNQRNKKFGRGTNSSNFFFSLSLPKKFAQKQKRAKKLLSLFVFLLLFAELLEGNKAMYKPCSKFSGKFEAKKAVFLCNDGLGHPGQFVYVRDEREEQEYFGLCEVEVFQLKSKFKRNQLQGAAEGRGGDVVKTHQTVG